MRTAQEALDIYLRDFKKHDLLGFFTDALFDFLPYEIAKPYLKDDVTEEEWNAMTLPLTVENVIYYMRDYMDFAWDKATEHRGISANRSVQKMQAWLLLLGDDELLAFATNDDNYAMYGAPILAKICEKYGFSMPDDHLTKNMMKGLPCCKHCQDGCI